MRIVCPDVVKYRSDSHVVQKALAEDKRFTGISQKTMDVICKEIGNSAVIFLPLVGGKMIPLLMRIVDCRYPNGFLKTSWWELKIKACCQDSPWMYGVK